MKTTMFKNLILSLLLINAFTVDIRSQQNKAARIKKKHIIGGIWASSLTTGILCDQLRLSNSNSEIEKYVIDSLADASTTFQIKNPIGLAIINSTHGAHAIRRMSCDSLRDDSKKQWLLFGDSVLNDGIYKSSPTELTVYGKLYLASLLGHEVAHFSQHESRLSQNRREAEFHGDFFAGWYLYNYIKANPQIDISNTRNPLTVMGTLMQEVYVKGEPGPCQNNISYPIRRRRIAMGEAGYSNGNLSLLDAMKKAKELTAKAIAETPKEIKCPGNWSNSGRN